MNLRSPVIWLFGVALGCASVPGLCRGDEITAEDVLAGASFDVDESLAKLVDEADVFALSPEMKAFLDSNVDHGARVSYRLRRLADAVIYEGDFNLEYSAATRTAAETFSERGGNCLSFTIMFVVMARYLSLDVAFQEVDIPPDWTRDSGVSVLNRHVNVHVDVGLKRYRVVDFNTDNFVSDFKMRSVSDRRILAHFYNNKGAEHMLAGDVALAFLYFRRALLDGDRGYSPAWTNLATLYLRQGFPAYAEAGYLEALEADRSDLVAISNLARIYTQQGDLKRAAEYEKKMGYHRNRNPYHRYQLARTAFDAEDFDAAIDHLKYAVRKRRHEDEFHFLLGLSYLRKGNRKSALECFARAEEASDLDAVKQKYTNKIESLQSISR